MDKAEQRAQESAATHIRFQVNSNISKPDQETGQVSQAASSSSNSESESPELPGTPSNLVESPGQSANGNAAMVDKFRKGRKRKKHSTGSDLVHSATKPNGKRKREDRGRKKQRTTQLA